MNDDISTLTAVLSGNGDVLSVVRHSGDLTAANDMELRAYVPGRPHEIVLCGKTNGILLNSAFLWTRESVYADNDPSCGNVPLPWNYIEVGVTQSNRVMLSFNEPLIQPTVSEVSPLTQQTPSCTDAAPCSESEYDGNIVMYGSHYDRGSDIVTMGSKVVAVGSMAGPAKGKNGDGDCFNSCGDDPTVRVYRSFDAVITQLDTDLLEPDQEDGLYRLLVNPLDVIVRCDPVETVLGSSGLEMAYGVEASNELNKVYLCGVLARTVLDDATDCGFNNPNEAMGDVNGLLFSVTDLGKVTQTTGCLLFGKRHDDIGSATSRFGPIERNVDQFALDEPQGAPGTPLTWLDQPRARSAEVFHDVAEARYDADELSLAIGFSSTSNYATSLPDPVSGVPRQKRGLFVGLSNFDGASSCSSIATKWAFTLSSDANVDKSLSMSSIDVIKTEQVPGGLFACVGYTQSHLSVFTSDLPGDKWNGSSSPLGTGVVALVSNDGSIARVARLFYSKQYCEDNGDSWEGLVRLFDIVGVDSDQDGNHDALVVVGGIKFPGQPLTLQTVDRGETMFVALLDIDLNLVWQRTLRVDNIVPTNHYSTLRTVAISAQNTIVAAGHASQMYQESGEDATPLVVELSLSGDVVKSSVVLREPNICDRTPSEDTHSESIHISGGRSFLIGTTCDYHQRVTTALGTPANCIKCPGNKGDILLWAWDCIDNHYSATSWEIGGLASITRYSGPQNELTAYKEVPRIVCVNSASLSTLKLTKVSIANVCDYLTFPDHTLEKQTYDETCPGNSDPYNNWDSGTHKGRAVIGPDCFGPK